MGLTSGCFLPFTTKGNKPLSRINNWLYGISHPQVSSIDVKGMPTGIVDRHITTNTKQDLVAIWWKDTQDSGWQWSSMADSGAYNILIFRVNKYVRSVVQFMSQFYTCIH